jgi:hypothetical protein
MNVRPHRAGRRATECLPSEHEFRPQSCVAHFRPLPGGCAGHGRWLARPFPHYEPTAHPLDYLAGGGADDLGAVWVSAFADERHHLDARDHDSRLDLFVRLPEPRLVHRDSRSQVIHLLFPL